MTSPFIGEIRAFSFQYAPTGWLACNGQTLPLNQYQALFALIGTTYGGNGSTNFQLPNLQGRIALSISQSSPWGEVQGTETVTLSPAQLPMHPHTINAAVNGTTQGIEPPGPTVILGSAYTSQASPGTVAIYSGNAPNTTLTPLSPNGGNQGHENRMPSLVMNYCIAMTGLFPSRG
jgi:microcystin-dependent protein